MKTMKRTTVLGMFFLSLAISLTTLTSSAQTPEVGYVVPTITTLKAYFGNANRITVTGTNQQFVICSPCVADEKKVYAGAGGRKWRKVVPTVADIDFFKDSVRTAIKTDSVIIFDPATKQDLLQAGVNIKNVNGQPITGPGDVTIDTVKNVPVITTLPPNGNVVIRGDKLMFFSNGFWKTLGVVDSVSGAASGQNFVRWSEDLENFSVWDFPQDSAMTVAANAVASPFGPTTAETITMNADFLPYPQEVAVTPNTTYTFSFYARRGTATAVNGLAVDDLTHSSSIVVGSNIYPLLNSSTWTRVSTTFTAPAGCTLIYVYMLRTLTERGTVHLFGAQVNQGSLKTYQKTTNTVLP